jgi:iron complex outermembrane receptor protein
MFTLRRFADRVADKSCMKGVSMKCGSHSLAAAALCLIAASSDSARAAPVPAEQDYLADLPVVLSVSRLKQAQGDAPGAVTVIDREMIRASGAREIAELLRLVPGFHVARAPQAPYALSYHGMATDFSRRVQVLIDGRSQYSPFYAGGVNWSLMPVAIEDIERIEVMRGSNSAAFGSNAFLGVVNIQTRSGADRPGATVALTSGQQSVNDRLVRGAWGDSAASVRATFENRRDNGIEGFFDLREKRLMDFRGDFRVSDRDELSVSLGALENFQGNGNGTAGNPRRVEKNSNDYFQLGWLRTLNPSESISLRFSHSHEAGASAISLTTVLPVVGLQVVPIDFGFHAWRDEIEVQHTFVTSPEMRFVWGGGYRNDNVYAPQFFSSRQKLRQRVGRLFGNMEWRTSPTWLFNIGASAESDSLSGTSFAPRLSAHFQPTPGHHLRLGISRAYRNPSLYEAHSNTAFVSTSGIVAARTTFSQQTPRPESILSRELGYVASSGDGRFQFDARAFREAVSDRIQSVNRTLPVPNCEFPFPLLPICGTADDYANAENVSIRGIEYQARWRPFVDTRLILNQSFVRLGQATLSFPSLMSATDVAKMRAQTLASSPTHATSLMLMQRLPGGFDLGLNYYWVGASKWSANTYASAFKRLDWRLAYGFSSGGRKAEIALTTRSDSAVHGEHDDAELVRRRGFVSLRLDM